MTEELDLSRDERWEDRFLGVPAVITLVVVLTVLGVVVGEPGMGIYTLPLLPVVLGARRALRRRKKRLLFLRGPVEDELQAWDQRDFGADFMNDFYAALPQGLLVVLFGWLSASFLWGTGWSGVVSWFGLAAASATLVAHVTEGGNRLVLFARGAREVREREKQEGLEGAGSEKTLPRSGSEVQYYEG